MQKIYLVTFTFNWNKRKAPKTWDMETCADNEKDAAALVAHYCAEDLRLPHYWRDPDIGVKNSVSVRELSHEEVINGY